MTDLINARQNWEQGPLARTLKKSPERKPEFTTSPGIPLDRIYVPDEAPVDYEQQLGFPGEYPFTRGVQPIPEGLFVMSLDITERKRPSRGLCLRQRTCPVMVIASD